MARRQRSLPSPHRRPVDLSRLDGVTVLGESLAVLTSGLLRLALEPPVGGIARLTARMPSREAEAILRAMSRVEREIKGDPRTEGERDVDRLLLVAGRVFEAVDVVRAAHAQQLFCR